MSAGSVSLESAIRTCKVLTDYADKVQSDRFLNPNNMVCPIWNGVDTAGRQVCPDSFNTKRAGCNSAEDRVVVENNQRPSYYEYITLSAGGLKGNIYGTMPEAQSHTRTNAIHNAHNYAGYFGDPYGANIIPSCGYYPSKQALAQEQQQMRGGQAMQMGYEGYSRRQASGF